MVAGTGPQSRQPGRFLRRVGCPGTGKQTTRRLQLFTGTLSQLVFNGNVVSAETVNTFKNRLDRFWSNQDVLYDYRADLRGTIVM